MGVLDRFKGHKAAVNGDDGITAVGAHDQTKHEEAGNYISETDMSSLDLIDKNEKDIQAHPDQITAYAQPGVQKAEAAALVWSKTTVYLLYAW